MSFIFKITTTTSPQTFVIPCFNEGTFNATVNYGDGTGSQTVTAYNDSNLTHSFATAGQHTITIDGTFPNVRFYDNAASRVLVDEVVDLGDVNWINLYQAFRDCTNLTAFNVGTTDTSSVNNMSVMFYNCNSLTSLDLSNFDTSNVTNISTMFLNCSSLTTLDVTSFDTSSVNTMSYMFRNCSSLTTLDVSGFDTSSVTTMREMFNSCTGLTALDLSNFDTSSVTTMQSMFQNCSSLTSLDLSNFDTSNVTTMQSMLHTCTSLTSLDLSGFDTSNVTVMTYMLYQCSSLTTLDVSSLDTSSVTNISRMFLNCTSLTNLDVKHFDISSVTNGTNFLSGSNNALTTTAYDELLEAWAAQDVQPNVPWHFGDAQYTVETIADWYRPRSNSSLSIINNKLVSIAGSTGQFGAAQQVDNLIIGNTYKIVGTATCSNSSATVYIRVSPVSNVNGTLFTVNSTGSVTANATFIATATTHYVGTIVTGHAANDTVTINAGITVKEITNYAEANAASEIEYSQENVFGSEEVVNGDFIGTGNVTSWTLESSAINNDGVNVFNVTAGAGTNVLATQTITLTIGRVYQLSFERLTGTTGCSVSASSAGLPTLYSGGVGVENRTFVATAASATLLINSGSGSTTVIIDNVSIKEITNAVEYKNIPQSARELYTLEDDTWVGSNELVVNGDFATDTTGWTPTGTGSLAWVSGELQLTSAAGYDQARQAIYGLTVGKTYKVTASIGASSSNTYVELVGAGAATPLSSSAREVTLDLIASSETLTIALINTGVEAVLYDNISFKEIVEVAP